MFGWMEFEAFDGRRKDLLREAEQRRLARELRRDRRRKVVERPEIRPAGTGEPVEVRWGMAEDDAGVARLMELNGMPRWIAFEERFVVAEREGELLAALRYRTEPKRLFLGLLVTDPWADERGLATALYNGAGQMARELCVTEVRATGQSYADYPRDAGFGRRGREWRLRVMPSEGKPEGGRAGGWLGRVLHLLGIPAIPFFRAFRG